MSDQPEAVNRPDWMHLTPGVEARSLWACLHDANLEALSTNLADRSALLEFDVFYLRDFHGLPEDTRFRFRFEGVGSVRALRSYPPEGVGRDGSPAPAPPVTRGLPHAEQDRVIRAYWALWREESVSWREFEAAFAEDPFDVYEAELAQSEGGVTLRLGGMFDSDWYTAVIGADRLTVERSDGVPCDLEPLVVMGEAYWEAFAARRSSPEATS